MEQEHRKLWRLWQLQLWRLWSCIASCGSPNCVAVEAVELHRCIAAVEAVELHRKRSHAWA